MYRHSKFFLFLAVMVPSIGVAANSCNAAVTKKSQKKSPTSWALEFDVKTNCQSSTGRFVFTYVDDRGRTIERRSPAWTPADGRSFILKDEFAEPGDLKSLTVVPSSVESTKSH